MRKIRGVESWHRLAVVSAVGGTIAMAGGYVLGRVDAAEGWFFAFLVVMVFAFNLLTVPYYIKRRAGE
jgi:hypothetical protein